MSPHLQRLCDFYADFSTVDLEQLSQLYAADCRFVDPVHEIAGIEDLGDYFARLGSALNYCHFRFHTQMESGNAAFLSWTMEYSHARIKKGAPLAIEGASELQFAEGLVQVHRDFYDMGAMLYEHLPVLGSVIGGIKARLV